MNAADTVVKLAEPSSILFAYIGWADFYDGTENVSGNFAWLEDHPIDNSEASAFVADNEYFYCGIGRGALGVARTHVAFVARDPADHLRKVVGLYAHAEPRPAAGNWMNVRTRYALRYPVDMRPVVPNWPGAQGIRRWAQRSTGKCHTVLRQYFEQLVRDFKTATADGLTQVDVEPFDALEGAARRRMIVHRHREATLRKAKIAEGLRAGRGRLRCQVPGCGFDFVDRYGALGSGYAEVHHLKPLASLDALGGTVRLSDLAIVCSNCHAMIHRGGVTRPLPGLIPPRPPNQPVNPTAGYAGRG